MVRACSALNGVERGTLLAAGISNLPVRFARTLAVLLLTRRRYIQEMQVTQYLELDKFFCTTATYNLEGATVPFFKGDVVTVYNYANENVVNGPNSNAKNMTLCARTVNNSDYSQLAVAPCFLPNYFAGPYWVIDRAPDYAWAIVIGGQPTEVFEDGCTTKQVGTNNAGLWLFSRTPVAPKEQIQTMRTILEKKGIARSQLHPVMHQGCNYTGALIKK